MGLHHAANHGHAFFGAEAREHLDIRKRDSHGNSIRLHTPSGFEEKEVVSTVESVVYVTMSADFTGSTAGYTTISPSPVTVTSTEAAAVTIPSSTITSAAAVSTASSTSSSSSSSSVNNKSWYLNPDNLAATSTSSAASTATLAAAAVSTAVAGTPVAATRAATTGDSTGLTTGAKAGIAIAVIAAIGLLAGLLFFCARRRKNKAAREEIIDEKRSSSVFGGFGGANKRNSAASDKVPASIRSTRTASTAPRLSLRPVTQFLPSLASDNRKSGGNLLDAEKPKSMWERRSNTAENPFDDAAVMSEKQARPDSPPANPFDEPEGSVDGRVSPQAEPATPQSAKFGTAAAVAVAAPAPKGPNNVHRVQLDFKPSMDDELELKSGQLVRMLHAYDDGWALCIRMDRSQQGVCPRTCLSKMPVKPRQGPPPGMAPQGRPAPGPNGNMVPRPLTPQSRERSGSVTAEGAVPSRKPVPGQAM